MQLIIFGAPGAGKGTMAQNIQKYKQFSHISTGDLFRRHIKEKTDLGKLASDYIEKGLLVPDEVTEKLIRHELDMIRSDFILDGFPRNIPQAEALDRILQDFDIKLTACVHLEIDPEIVIERLVNRMSCQDCGAPYNLVIKKPKVENVCDECGGKLTQRADDNEETIRHRFETYRAETEPLARYYENKGLLMTVNCNEGILTKLDQVWEDLAALED
ncbi:MAG: adenylate kinase [Clostridiaceae bacterium]|nr:adenylate kinase [Clostridiaceae bacterium]